MPEGLIVSSVMRWARRRYHRLMETWITHGAVICAFDTIRRHPTWLFTILHLSLTLCWHQSHDIQHRLPLSPKFFRSLIIGYIKYLIPRHFHRKPHLETLRKYVIFTHAKYALNTRHGPSQAISTNAYTSITIDDLAHSLS